MSLREKPKRKLLENLCGKLHSGDECSQKRKCCDTQLMSRVVLVECKKEEKKDLKCLLELETLKSTSSSFSSSGAFMAARHLKCH
jgi:hypothetical protein